jgi:hypothetical protein
MIDAAMMIGTRETIVIESVTETETGIATATMTALSVLGREIGAAQGRQM